MKTSSAKKFIHPYAIRIEAHNKANSIPYTEHNIMKRKSFPLQFSLATYSARKRHYVCQFLLCPGYVQVPWLDYPHQYTQKDLFCFIMANQTWPEVLRIAIYMIMIISGIEFTNNNKPSRRKVRAGSLPPKWQSKHAAQLSRIRCSFSCSHLINFQFEPAHLCQVAVFQAIVPSPQSGEGFRIAIKLHLCNILHLIATRA